MDLYTANAIDHRRAKGTQRAHWRGSERNERSEPSLPGYSPHSLATMRVGADESNVAQVKLVGRDLKGQALYFGEIAVHALCCGLERDCIKGILPAEIHIRLPLIECELAFSCNASVQHHQQVTV